MLSRQVRVCTGIWPPYMIPYTNTKQMQFLDNTHKLLRTQCECPNPNHDPLQAKALAEAKAAKESEKSAEAADKGTSSDSTVASAAESAEAPVEGKKESAGKSAEAGDKEKEDDADNGAPKFGHERSSAAQYKDTIDAIQREVFSEDQFYPYY